MQKSAHARNVIQKTMTQATALVVFVILVDQYTKYRASLLEQSWGISGWIESIKHQNYGIVANIPIPQWITILATLVILFYITMLFLKEQSRSRFFLLAYSFLLGGAFGNLLDRIRLGFVFDWILLFGRSAINIADIVIVIGILLYLIGLNRCDKEEREKRV